MDLRQLKYFVTIVEEGQITKAAKKLHMAQPPLSHQLKMMEQELDCILFDRNGRNLELTQSGKILYEKGQKLLLDFEDTLLEVKEVGKGLKGILSIGVVQTCLSYIPEILMAMREKYPNVQFKIIEGDSDYLKKCLIHREIEIAILDLPPTTNEFSTINLAAELFVLVAPERLNLKKHIKMAKVKHFPLLMLQYEKNASFNKFILEECRRHGFEPNIVCECSDTLMLLSLVRAGVGVALLPETVLNTLSLNRLNIINIEDCSLQRKPTIIWSNDRYLSQNALHFLEFFTPKTTRNYFVT